ncbi:uncharacterized protein LOC143283730 [Babylonia areolata]|uniref:uncharacterized protein LOC143283730 n=1 Tax=Babylonia areolata TaxID=304850 RepID=UPI003FCFDBD1
MSSIHYPTLVSVDPRPVQPQPQRRESFPLHHVKGRKTSTTTTTSSSSPPGGKPGIPDRQRSGSRDRNRDRDRDRDRDVIANRKRSSFPLLPQPRGLHDDVNVTTSSPSRHSITEVVARMRVREKTLLGEDLFKGRGGGGGGGGGGGHGSASSGGKASPNAFHHPSGTTAAENAAPTTYRQAESFRQDAVYGDVEARTSVRKDVARAWETPRGRPSHGASGPASVRPSVSWGFHLATGQDSTHAERPAGQSRAEGERRAHEDDIHRDEAESPLPEDAVVRDGDGVDENEYDDDFDFDEGEEEVAAQREQYRTCGTTKTVYQRACQVLRVQPSPAFLRQVNIAVMDLRDVRLGPADVKPIAIALVRDGRLCSLDLSNNDLGPIGVSYIAEMLQENTSLTDLNLSATQPGREGVKALCETLRHNRTLAYLWLEENGIEHTESHLLADLIRSVPTLRGLYLGHNRLGYHGGAAIASAIAQNSSMQTLDLQWNHIRRDSAVALVRALGTNRCLRSLNLAWNGLGKEGCLALAHVLPKNSSLRELDLTCNRVDLMSLGFLLKGVTKNTSLHCLRIGQNPLTTDGAKALINAVASTPQLNISDIDICGVPVDLEFTQLVASAQETRVLRVRHEEAVTLATSDRKREHEGTNLDRFDPVTVLFEYMKLDNLRVIDMFQFMDVKKKDKLSKGNIRDGLNTLKIPVTEHAIDVIFQKLDINKDGFVELDEMMKVQRDTARQVKLRQIKAKAKNKEDGGLTGLHKTLREIIAKRKEEKDPRGGRDANNSNSNSVSSTKTTGGGRKASVGGLQLTQARYSVTSSKPAVVGAGAGGRGGGGGGDDALKPLTSVADDDSGDGGGDVVV